MSFDISLAVPVFTAFPKIARLSRECVIKEKIDGTNAQIYITDDGEMLAGSRSRWITPADDNFGFARWVAENRDELLKLGPGRHFGEWWGSGIQRGYGLQKGEKRFSLFNTARWVDSHDDSIEILGPSTKQEYAPACCHVVPVLYTGPFSTNEVNFALNTLMNVGSLASPGFMNPEGVICYHTAAKIAFKKTIEKDDEPKTCKR